MEGNEQASPKSHCAWGLFGICFLMVGCAFGSVLVPACALNPVMVYDAPGAYIPAMVGLCGCMAVVSIVMQCVIGAAHAEWKKREPEG